MIIDNTERERGKEKKLDTVCLAAEAGAEAAENRG